MNHGGCGPNAAAFFFSYQAFHPFLLRNSAGEEILVLKMAFIISGDAILIDPFDGGSQTLAGDIEASPITSIRIV
jgi:hypothetical protein